MRIFGHLTAAFVAQKSLLRSQNPRSEVLRIKSGDDAVVDDTGRNMSRPPPTPCTRICRYNANFYDGQVCIGCFREAYEISHWSRMSHTERMYALLDAVDRADGRWEGAISQEELTRQAASWGTMTEE